MFGCSFVSLFNDSDYTALNNWVIVNHEVVRANNDHVWSYSPHIKLDKQL